MKFIICEAILLACLVATGTDCELLDVPEATNQLDSRRFEQIMPVLLSANSIQSKSEGQEQNPRKRRDQNSQENRNSHSDHMTNLRLIDELLTNYDRRETPSNNIGEATNVNCELYIRSFGSISEKTMDFEADLYLSQTWSDSRLHHIQLTKDLDLNDPILVKAIWKPEVYFPNAKEGEFQLKMKFACMMELYKYPLDEQVCSIEIASFSKTTQELILNWLNDNSIQLSGDLKMPQFTVRRITTGHCPETSHLGNYSCLEARFQMSRSAGFHMVQSFIPTTLFVMISWVSFWMDTDSVAGRITLGVTTLLTISSKSAGLSAESPQVSYVKSTSPPADDIRIRSMIYVIIGNICTAIDIWMGGCTAFIFAALVEFTMVNYIWRTEKLQRSGNLCTMCKNQLEQNDSINVQPVQKSSTYEEDGQCEHNPLRHEQQQQQQSVAARPARGQAQRIDELCRVLFPVCFGIFNAVYWTYYYVY